MQQIFKLLFSLLSFIIIGGAFAQEGHYVGTDYKFGYSRLSTAYVTYNPSPTASTPLQSDYTFYADGFFQKNLSVFYGYLADNIYFKTNIDGLFNWVFHI